MRSWDIAPASTVHGPNLADRCSPVTSRLGSWPPGLSPSNPRGNSPKGSLNKGHADAFVFFLGGNVGRYQAQRDESVSQCFLLYHRRGSQLPGHAQWPIWRGCSLAKGELCLFSISIFWQKAKAIANVVWMLTCKGGTLFVFPLFPVFLREKAMKVSSALLSSLFRQKGRRFLWSAQGWGHRDRDL